MLYNIKEQQQENKLKIPNCAVRDAYRRSIAKVWGLKQKDIKGDIHIAYRAPGQWSPDSSVEIYCEGLFPNATDVHYSVFCSPHSNSICQR